MYLTKVEEQFIVRVLEKHFNSFGSSDKYLSNRVTSKFEESRERSKASMRRYLDRKKLLAKREVPSA